MRWIKDWKRDRTRQRPARPGAGWPCPEPTHPRLPREITTAVDAYPEPDEHLEALADYDATVREYYDLRGILAPIGDTQRTCNVTVLPADLQSAYNTFMAG